MAKVTFLSGLFTVTDEQAMWRVQTEEDHRAFAMLVERWEKPIYNLCVRMTGDAHRGEDLKQEIFARVFEKRMQYNPSMRFSTWLWRVALNLCYDELRRCKRRQGVMTALPEDSDLVAEAPDSLPAPDQAASREEEGAMVREAMLRLPEIYRVVLVLRHYEGLKLREIAEVLEIAEGTVNSRMAEAISLLSKQLERKLGPAPRARTAPRITAREPLMV